MEGRGEKGERKGKGPLLFEVIGHPPRNCVIRIEGGQEKGKGGAREFVSYALPVLAAVR